MFFSHLLLTSNNLKTSTFRLQHTLSSDEITYLTSKAFTLPNGSTKSSFSFKDFVKFVKEVDFGKGLCEVMMLRGFMERVWRRVEDIEGREGDSNDVLLEVKFKIQNKPNTVQNKTHTNK